MVKGTFWEITPKKSQHFKEKIYEITKIFLEDLGRFLAFLFLNCHI
jgi:hypothetical protein